MSGNGITLEQLVAYAAGELDPGRAAAVEAYLAAVPPAAANAARLQDVIETMRADDAEPPTATAVRRALAAWSDARAGTVLEWLHRAERVVAQLVFDNRQRLVMAGFRGAPSGFQLAYAWPRGRMDLQILRRPRGAVGSWRIRGQVAVTDGPSVGSVALVSRGTAEAVAATVPDEHGRFRVDTPPGGYDLLVELEDGRRAIVAPDIAIGSESD